jgi:hypothetical protein
MLYQMVSGHKPFNASDAQELRRKIVEEMPVGPHELNPGLPPRVSEIILKALAKAPGERYGSGAELLNDLENYKRVEVAPPQPASSKAAAPASSAGTRIWSPAGSGTLPAASKKPAPAPPSPVASHQPAAPPPPAAGTRVWSPAGSGTSPAAKPASPPPAAPAVPTPKPQAAPAPPKPEPQPPAPAPVPTPKAERAAAAKTAAPALPPHLLMYGMAGAIVLLLVVVGVLWMRRTPQPDATFPSAGGAAALTPAQGTAATPAPGTAGSQPSGTPRPARQKKQPVEAPVAAPVTGGLSVDSSPQGAEVQIDGRHEAGWVTPFTTAGLVVGGHTVSLSKPGYTAASRTAQVAAGQNAVLTVQLAELAAAISVNSEPAGAAITVDGKDTGKVTPAQIIVAKGSHSILVRKPGYLDASGALETAPGQTAQFSPTLKLTGNTENIKTVGKLGGLFGGAQENSGRVSVRTNPKGAQVSVNGQPVKKTTPVDFYLNPGSYELSLTLAGYKPVKKIIDVEKGGKLTLDETLAH